MHVLLTTIPFPASTDARKQLITEFDRTLARVDGLLMKIWFWDEISVSIAHFFRGELELNTYLTSGVLSALNNHHGCNGSVTSRIYEVPYADIPFEAAKIASATSPIEINYERQKLEVL